LSKDGRPIYVSKPHLPPLEEFNEFLQDIWRSKIITNQGKYHQEFEKALCEYLGVKYVSLFANGTLALIVALKTLDIAGEVITTPFSFVATGNSLLWNNNKPVFVDIEANNFTLDPENIEPAITKNTTAIMPVHVYGNPCKLEEIQDVASQYGLKIVYDAAHAFGVKINGNSILNYGDLSVLSFHATKVFNTFEGGAIVCHDKEIKEKIDNLKNFGIIDETTVVAPGINAKMNEFQAALGLLQLKYIDRVIEKRKKIATLYKEKLDDLFQIKCFGDRHCVKYNYAYFPVLINEEIGGKSRDYIYEELKKYSIYTRKYFYPLISQHEIYSNLDSAKPGRMPVAEKITEKVLCLPIYPDLEASDVEYIIQSIKKLLI
jgi:dTDP-4-amino-4,6-dideoxygalactose transaminase